MEDANYYKLTKQPLLFVLAEFRFPVIMQMENFLPEIQEKLRQELPLFEEQQSQDIKLQNDSVQIVNSRQWAFIDKHRQKTVILEPSRIICSVSDYERFDGFEEFCLRALNTLKDIVRPSFIQRIGLRYADLVVSEDDDVRVSEYVEPSLYNNANFDEVGGLIRKVNEFVLETEEGHMIVRTMFGNHNLSTFPDMNLPINLAVLDGESERVLLDFDHIWEAHGSKEPLDFESEIISNKLKKMHRLSRKAFWNSITEKGIEAWS
ncbi:hypothetical protein CEQ07_09205 [Oligella urethralis]|uniref:TIGR04255 family protein n=1 Tax=Oligella urethralis TaxID=90245 RepID=UPI000D003370|nr:TIGR04255 family protein [Oligella urethralis]AVL71579.1 hypothetical protein CEQ07_09205 [Oligella urethralis]